MLWEEALSVYVRSESLGMQLDVDACLMVDLFVPVTSCDRVEAAAMWMD